MPIIEQFHLTLLVFLSRLPYLDEKSAQLGKGEQEEKEKEERVREE